MLCLPGGELIMQVAAALALASKPEPTTVAYSPDDMPSTANARGDTELIPTAGPWSSAEPAVVAGTPDPAAMARVTSSGSRAAPINAAQLATHGA